MDKTLLVAAEVAAGSRLLEALDHSDLATNVALWINLAEKRRLAPSTGLAPAGRG